MEPAKGGPRVLVIEDEAGMAEVLSLHLAAAGLQVETIGDGFSALARLGDPPPDLVLIDLGLPKVSGYRVMKVLRQTPGWQNTPVVIVTAYNFEEAQEVIKEGADDFISKPFDMQDLLARVGNVLAKRRAAR